MMDNINVTTFKALSIRQPFADHIASGRKTIEVRSRQTKYRGAILICSSIKLHEGKIRWYDSDIGVYHVESAKQYVKDYDIFNFGVALAIANLYDCTVFKEEHQNDALIPFIEKHYAWHLKDIIQITPFQVRGKLGIFNIDIPHLIEI